MTKSVAHVRDVLDMSYGPPIQILSDCLRGFLIPEPGKFLVALDLAQIEARVLAWLAGEERVLTVFNTHGKLYEAAAADIHGVSIDEITKSDPRRQSGKVAELALGFQGGKGAIHRMSKPFGVKYTDAEADAIKTAWRAKRPNIVKYWPALNQAAKNAIFSPGVKFTAGHRDRPITYKKDGTFLWCRLPSGRVLCYPYPRIEMVDAPWTKDNGEKVQAVTYMCEESQGQKWTRTKAYGGLFCENVTQAVARDVLVSLMLNLEAAGFKIVLHVHDEAVVETDDVSEATIKRIEELCLRVPAWATGLPLAGETWVAVRYRK